MLKAVAVSLMVSVLVLAGAANATAATAPKARSQASQATGRRTYGAPIQPPILHRRHKQGGPTSNARTTKSAGKKRTRAPPR